jgi:hypothetical protein
MDTSEKQIKKIVLNRMERCAVCHHVFAPEDIHVLSRKSDMWMMVVACTECHARNFVAAVLGDGDPSQAQLALRRLSEQSARAGVELAAAGGDPVAPAAPVSIDDVLEMHEFLRGFDGDFQRLFRSGG